MTTAFRRLATTLTATVLAGGLLTACAGADADTLTVAASSTPHAEILRHVEESGALGDVQLDIMTLNAGPEGNAAVANGSADVNFFQHEPFLHEWTAQNDSDNLVVLAPVHIEPMSVYSGRHDSLDDLPEGAKVLLPRTETNFARGLRILQAHGLLTLDDQAQDGHAVVKLESVVDNPRNLELVAVEDELAPRGLADESVAAAIISSNYAMEAGLDPVADALVTEAPEDNPYANILVGNTDSAEDGAVRDLVAAVTSAETAEWIRGRFGSAVIPVTG